MLLSSPCFHALAWLETLVKNFTDILYRRKPTNLFNPEKLYLGWFFFLSLWVSVLDYSISISKSWITMFLSPLHWLLLDWFVESPLEIQTPTQASPGERNWLSQATGDQNKIYKWWQCLWGGMAWCPKYRWVKKWQVGDYFYLQYSPCCWNTANTAAESKSQP